jgi:hypothetical protein
MIDASATSTEEVVSVSCARPTGGSHGRTTDAPAQRFKGAKRRPRQRGAPQKRGQGHYKGREPRRAPPRLAKVAGEGMLVPLGIMRPQRMLGREGLGHRDGAKRRPRQRCLRRARPTIEAL